MERFSHTTAAEMWGAPLPAYAVNQVQTAVPPGASRAKAAGVIGHESSSYDFAIRSGVRVSTAVDTFLELASILTVDDLVEVGDYLVLDPHLLDPHDIRPYAGPAELLGAATAFRGRGARAARSAAVLVRGGVESPMETRLRLLLARHGLPTAACGYALFTPQGRRVGWFDLAWPEWKVIAEYDGDQHRTSTTQYERDIRRFDEAADLGWRVIRVRKRGLVTATAETCARVESALRAHGWRREPPQNAR